MQAPLFTDLKTCAVTDCMGAAERNISGYDFCKRHADTIDSQSAFYKTPPHNGTDTSKAAALSVAPVAGTLRAKVLDYIEAMGIIGALEEEIALACGMRLSSVCARVNELVKLGLVIDSGERRRTTSGRLAAVFTSAPPTRGDGPRVHESTGGSGESA